MPTPSALRVDPLQTQLQAAIGDTYVIERELGGGGMSRLFLARERSLDRDVVIKLLPADLANSVALERFRREMSVIARLQHPHIVPIIGTASGDGLSWYVMPFLRGESLRHRLDRDGMLPVEEGARILREIGDALAHAHRLGVVHRDIKPANILLSDGHAVLADFGVAQARERQSGPREALTGTGMALGTPGYMAPEQLSADPVVDARADIYALAVVGYEMLTGTPTFAGLSGGALMAAHMRDKPVSPRTIRPEIPPAIGAALEKALAKAPADRFQAADDFVAALAPRNAAARAFPIARAAAITAVGIALIAGATVLPKPRYFVHKPLDASMVAVLPFTALAPQLGVWREGMVDVLARNLDGWGATHTVPPAIAVRAVSGAVDATNAAELGKRLGAGVVIFGSLYQSGPDSTRVAVTVFDVASGKSIADLERREETTRLERLTDSITVAIAGALGKDKSAAALSRVSSIGSRSLPAIKEFLQGERLLRLTGFDSALAHFHRATELDSNFALAWSGVGEARGWMGINAESNGAQLRAGRLNHGLRPRDSLLVLADSAWAAMRTTTDPKANGVAQRLAEVLAAATLQFPDDPRGWYKLGDVRSHYGTLDAFGATPTSTLNAFDRAIALDSAMLEAYIHPVQLALQLGDVRRARTYAQRYLEREAAGSYAESMRLFLWLSEPRGRDDAELRKLADTLADRSRFVGEFQRIAGRAMVDSSATFARMLATLGVMSNDETSNELNRWRQEAVQEFTAAGRLHSADSLRIPGGTIHADDPAEAIALVKLGVLPGDAFARSSMDKTHPARHAWPAMLPFWITRKDTARIREVEAQFVGANLRRPRADTPRLVAWMHGVGDASVLLARADTARARAAFAALAPAYPQLDRLLRQEILAPVDIAQHRYTDAVRKLTDITIDAYSGDPVVGMARELLLARAAEGAGDYSTARVYYRKLATLWAHSDPAFAPLVAEVRAAQARLDRAK